MITPVADITLHDAGTPGGVYLCQVSGGVSCGACCGLYNLADCRPENLVALLQTRTRRFAEVPRTADAIDRFGHDTLQREPQQRPFEGFHHCPYLGWIADNPGRVGCLLHPLAAGNQGIDFRGLSYYGGLACRSYFCPSTHELPARYKRIVRLSVADWFLYGLVITEKELLTALLAEAEKRLGAPLNPELFVRHPDARGALGDLLALKLEWPFRPVYWDTPCHYFFKENPKPRPEIDYRRIGTAPSRFDAILRQLVSDFSSFDQFSKAEQMIESALARLTGIVQQRAA